MGNEYSSPFDYPECKEKHNSFKDVNTNFTFGDKISIASRIFTNNIEDTFLFQYTKRCKMIKDGDFGIEFAPLAQPRLSDSLTQQGASREHKEE